MDNLKKKIEDFIKENFPAAKKKNIDWQTSLLETGIIDSLGVLEIVNFIDEELDIEIDEDDLMPENFETIQAMAEFISKKKVHNSI